MMSFSIRPWNNCDQSKGCSVEVESTSRGEGSVKRGFQLFLLVLLMAVSGCQLPSELDGLPLSETEHNQSESRNGKVLRVIDGDTLLVDVEGSKEKVRLIGVNTPETRHPEIGAQYFGKEASRYTEGRLQGKRVRLETDVEERDQYGRLLAYVWLGDELFNATLIEEGMAQVMTVPPNEHYRDRFQQLQNEARKKGVGMWKEKGREGRDVEDCSGEIKGNITGDGDRIYHTRESPQYEVTQPERWFCTEKEAKAAGFRPPKGVR